MLEAYVIGEDDSSFTLAHEMLNFTIQWNVIFYNEVSFVSYTVLGEKYDPELPNGWPERNGYHCIPFGAK